jgi:hypothetical protein
MESIKAVLSKDEVRTFRRCTSPAPPRSSRLRLHDMTKLICTRSETVVVEHDRFPSDLGEVILLRRLRTIFLPSSSRSTMSEKDKFARREVLEEFERQIKAR